ncbi:NBS-LRR type resistance protein [Cucumis melo var. makuwa]|uniref:NBS-LRR type resistance protein n=1 Tax=Cucumis melo var. makuwa TaxID=1194695 RepID=A0A5A7TVB9_CUCMM|nr:NBS-LRR type resistance protein [Cucumis melo var. makuwa]TYK27373.1 NBS-LRR type resistance protein [Cucumis melo var. makuwa]
MRPSFNIRCYNGCIVSGLGFHTSERDFRRTTQNSEVMVIGESNASGSGLISSFLSGFDEIDAMFLEFTEVLDNPVGGSSSVGDNLGLLSIRCSTPLKIPRRLSQALKEYSDFKEAVRTHHTFWWDVMRIDTTSWIEVVLQQQHELAEQRRESVNRVKFFRQTHVQDETFVCRLQMMHIIKCWKFNLSLSQRVLSHSLGTRYARQCWVDDRTTKKALVGTQVQGSQDGQCKHYHDLMFIVHGRASFKGCT